MMSSIDLLSAMLSSREAVLRGESFGAGMHLKKLVSAGVLVPVGHVASIVCSECSEPHQADVEPAEGGLGWRCLEAGFVAADPASVAAFEVRVDVLAERLQAATGIKRPAAAWPHDAPCLWSIGTFEFGRYAVDVCLAPNVADLQVFNELARFLVSPRGHPHGTAVLTNDKRRLESVSLPGSARIVYLGDVTSLSSNGQLIVDREAVARRALPARLLRLPSPGRPADKRQLVCEVLGELDGRGELEDVSERETERRVRAELIKRFGAEASLGRSTFLDALNVYRSR